MKPIYSNIAITVIALGMAGAIGSLLQKAAEENRTKVERVVRSTANQALAHGYNCRAEGRDLAECQHDLWTHGARALPIFGAVK